MDKEEKQRTDLQRKSLQVYLTELSGGLNDGGFTQIATMDKFKSDFDIPWTDNSLKEIFRHIGFLMYEKDSTAKLTTVEMQEVYRVFDMRFSEITGVHFEWPSEESLQFKRYWYVKK